MEKYWWLVCEWKFRCVGGYDVWLNKFVLINKILVILVNIGKY